MSHATIIAKLETHIETTFGAGTMTQEPVTVDVLKEGEGTLAAVEYTVTDIDFYQQEIVYPFQAVLKRVAGNDSIAARATLYTDLETIRDAIHGDSTLTGTVDNAAVTSLLVQSGAGQNEIIGVLEIAAQVTQ